MTSPFILGIDPGLGGALAVYKPSGPVLYDMPLDFEGKLDPIELSSIVGQIAWEFNGITAVVENVSSRPRQAGAFAFGLSTGTIHGCLACHGIPYQLVAPSLWKPRMGLTKRPDETQAENKSRARELAKQLFPACADKFKRVRDDGRAEALLMAVYWSSRGGK
jgi:crossover junction endodeoxyribonuclease RuvC